MHFCVECKPDLTLIKALTGVPNRDIVHSGNKSRVIDDLVERYEDSVGLVDEDPGNATSTKMKRFVEIRNVNQYSYLVLEHARRRNHVIVLRPRLEEWVLNVCRVNNVDITNFGLPNNVRGLKDHINHKLPQFTLLLDDLVKTQHFKDITKTIQSFSSPEIL